MENSPYSEIKGNELIGGENRSMIIYSRQVHQMLNSSSRTRRFFQRPLALIHGLAVGTNSGPAQNLRFLFFSVIQSKENLYFWTIQRIPERKDFSSQVFVFLLLLLSRCKCKGGARRKPSSLYWHWSSLSSLFCRFSTTNAAFCKSKKTKIMLIIAITINKKKLHSPSWSLILPDSRLVFPVNKWLFLLV